VDVDVDDVRACADEEIVAPTATTAGVAEAQTWKERWKRNEGAIILSADDDGGGGVEPAGEVDGRQSGETGSETVDI